MGFPWLPIAVTSAAGSLMLTVFAEVEATRQKTVGLQLFSLLFAVETFLWGVYCVLIYPFYVSPLRHLPMPPGRHWLWGHGLIILREPTAAPAMRWINTIPNDGLMRYLWFFNIERVLIVSPKSMAEVLVTKNYTFPKPLGVRQAIGRILGYGVLLAEGDEHRVQRRNLMPAFAFRHVKDLYSVFWGKTQEVVEAMAARCDKDGMAELEVMDWAGRCTLDIIGLAGMGKDFGAIQDENNELVQTYKFLFEPSKQARILGLLGAIFPPKLIELLPVKRNGDINSAANAIRRVCFDLIQEKRAKRVAGKEVHDVDILSVAMDSGQFSDANLVDQLMTFLAAGHETTATAMTWAIYMLARNPEMQDRLRAEIRERIPHLSGTVSSVDIDGMPYLNAVCNEVLRYWSPVPHTFREAAEDTTILDQPVPRGTRVVLAPWATNKDTSLWGTDANEFNPERWLAKGEDAAVDRKAASGGASSNYAFVTFLHGPRSCIGQSFAKAEFACLLAGWIGKFSFELQDKEMHDESKVDIRSGITARPANGMHVIAKAVPGF